MPPDIRAVLRSAEEQIPQLCHKLQSESSKLVSGWQKIDKLRMHEIIQSMYHVSWTLKDLRENFHELGGEKQDFGLSTYEDLVYEDIDDLSAADLQKRTLEFFSFLKGIAQAISQLLHTLNSFGIVPYKISFLSSRLFLDLHFLKTQLEKAFGVKLED